MSLDRKLQIRVTNEQHAAWVEKAGGEKKLSKWIRDTLDREAVSEPEPFDMSRPEEEQLEPWEIDQADTAIGASADVIAALDYDDNSPELPDMVPLPAIIVPLPPMLDQNGETTSSPAVKLDPMCLNAVYHWQLTAGQSCERCGGSV